MTDRKQQILELITKQPGIRDVEIADKIDIDLDQVHRDLSDAVSNNEVWVEKIIAPNGLKVNGYSRNPASRGWKTPQTATPAIQPRTVSTPVAPVVSPAVEELTKVDKAIAYLTANGSVTPRDLAIAMGLDVRKQSPSQYLGHCIRSGRIVKDGKFFRLGVEGGIAAAEMLSPAQKERLADQQARDFSKSSAPAAAVAPPVPASMPPASEPAITPASAPVFACALNSNGELLLERGEGLTRLSASETNILRSYFDWITSSDPFPASMYLGAAHV